MDIKKMKQKYLDTFYEWWTYPEEEFISTGFPNLDFVMWWGIPVGRFVELFWDNGTGKTTLSMQIANRVTDAWDKVLFIDTERTYPNRLWNDNIDVHEPSSWEDAVDRIVEGIKGWYKLIILDSVASTVPMYELETDTAAWSVAKHARLMNKMVRRVVWLLSEHWCTLLMINQLRGTIWGYINLDVTTWGVWLKYACSLRMQIMNTPKKWWIMDWDEVALKPAKIKIIKTKMRWGNDETILYLWSDGHYSELMDTLVTCLEYEVIKKNWAFIKYKWETLWQWLIRTALFLKNKPKLLLEMKVQLQERLKLKVAWSWMLFSTSETKEVYNKLASEYNDKYWELIELLTIENMTEVETAQEEYAWECFDSLEDIIAETGKAKSTIHKWLKDWKIKKNGELYYLTN